AIRRQAAVLTWLSLPGIVWAALPKSGHGSDLIYGLRESPVVAAVDPWSLYQFIYWFERTPFRTFSPLHWAVFGIPAAVSLWILALLLQFRLALWRSERLARRHFVNDDR
ncbi:MAG: hypothetical protein JWQ20_4535, partial [Conexibacter sp.]|nr:hypothetical protein [Conexibacter sp.]